MSRVPLPALVIALILAVWLWMNMVPLFGIIAAAVVLMVGIVARSVLSRSEG